MEKEIKAILLKKNYQNNTFNYNTPYGTMVIKYDNHPNTLHLVKFFENSIWKNERCKEALQYQLNKISQNFKKSKL